MLKLIAFTLLLIQGYPRVGPGTAAPHGGGGSVCTSPPTSFYHWPTYGSTNTCAGGSACTNGAGMDKLVDVVAANNAVQSTSGNRPIYTTGQVNGLPANVYTAGGTQTLTFPTRLPDSGNLLTLYAVVKPNSGSGPFPLMGPSVGGLEWRINSGHQELLLANISGIGVGTATISSSVYSMLVAQYNETTGAYAFYECSGGTCTLDASGTTLVSVTGPDSIGFSTGDGSFGGGIADEGFINATTTTGIGAYALACFAI